MRRWMDGWMNVVMDREGEGRCWPTPLHADDVCVVCLYIFPILLMIPFQLCWPIVLGFHTWLVSNHLFCDW